MKKILLIDDSDTYIWCLQKYLQRRGYPAKTAFTLRDARTVIKEEIPLVICCNLDLPDGSGMGFLDDVRAVDKEIPLWRGCSKWRIPLSGFCRSLSSPRTTTLPRNMNTGMRVSMTISYPRSIFRSWYGELCILLKIQNNGKNLEIKLIWRRWWHGKLAVLDISESGRQIGEKLFALLDTEQQKDLLQYILNRENLSDFPDIL